MRVSTPDDTWPTGVYELTLTTDGHPRSCTLDLAEPLPPVGVVYFECSEPMSALLNNSLSYSPKPGTSTVVEGHHQIQAGVAGLPASVRVELRRDGQLLLDQQQAPAYQDNEVNGPGCGTCRQGTVSMTIGA